MSWMLDAEGSLVILHLSLWQTLSGLNIKRLPIEEEFMLKIEYLGSVPDLPPWSPHLWDFVPRSKYVHYQVRKYGLDVPNIELSTFRSTRFHHWSGAWFWHCDFCVRDGVCLSLLVFSPSFLSLWRSQLHCLVRLNYSEWRYNDGAQIMPHAYFVLCKLGRGNTLAMHCGRKNNLQLNKTKYFCSDSMMKYALREGLERAKRELRES